MIQEVREFLSTFRSKLEVPPTSVIFRMELTEPFLGYWELEVVWGRNFHFVYKVGLHKPQELMPELAHLIAIDANRHYRMHEVKEE